MKTTILVIVGSVVIMGVIAAIGTALNIVTIPWLKLDRQVQMERDITEKTYDADNALYNYRWFKDRHEMIKATETQIENADADIERFEASAGPRSSWTFEDKGEHSRLVAVRTGLKNHYEELVAEYNSRAKQADRSIFQNELPLFFSLKPY